MLSLRLNVAALPQDKMVKGKKGVYIDLTLNIDDQENEYNQSVSSWISQSVEERDNKKPRVWTGNGRVFWSNGNALPVNVKDKEVSPEEPKKDNEKIDLPFDL